MSLTQLGRLLIFLFLLVTVGWGGADRAGQLDDIREAVFRYQFDHCERQGVGAYVLSVGADKEGVAQKRTGRQEDPDDELMRRFQGHQPPIVQASVWQQTPTRWGRVSAFHIMRIAWINDHEVTVEGSCGIPSDQEREEFLYRVMQAAGAWVVQEHSLLRATDQDTRGRL